MRIKGIIFDMDGVVTKTASIHFRAWKMVIDELLVRINPEKNFPFTEKEYFYYLDGIPRIDGLRNFLISREISFEDIPGSYPTMDEYIKAICNIKNDVFLEILTKEPVECYQDTLEFINLLLENNYAIAIISSSKNCAHVLKSAQVEHLFPVCIDGVISEEFNLPGKPHPAIFIEAAKRLNLLPHECIVVEDALSGVKAAKDGGFHVIALDRRNKLYSEFLSLEADYIIPNLSSSQKLLHHYLFHAPKHAPESAFNAFPIILDLIHEGYDFAIFLDYDGTLTPIAARPEQAVLSQEMQDCLTYCSQKYPTVIISGRELGNLKKHITIPTLFYSGNHGLQLEGPKNSEIFYQIGDEFKEDVQVVYEKLSLILEPIDGCLIENKIFSLSVHYRLVDEGLHDFISYKIDNIIKNHPKLARFSGKKVFEIRPNIPWNKGTASANILNQFKSKNTKLIPIYIGDDVTDEDAFKKFITNGITIKVTNEFQKTHAHYFLNSPLEVQNFLENMNCYKEVCYESLDYQLS